MHLFYSVAVDSLIYQCHSAETTAWIMETSHYDWICSNSAFPFEHLIPTPPRSRVRSSTNSFGRGIRKLPSLTNSYFGTGQNAHC